MAVHTADVVQWYVQRARPSRRRGDSNPAGCVASADCWAGLNAWPGSSVNDGQDHPPCALYGGQKLREAGWIHLDAAGDTHSIACDPARVTAKIGGHSEDSGQCVRAPVRSANRCRVARSIHPDRGCNPAR